MIRSVFATSVVVVVLFTAACGPTPEPCASGECGDGDGDGDGDAFDGGVEDADGGAPADAGGGEADAGSPGVVDGGVGEPDAGPPDGGAGESDAGAPCGNGALDDGEVCDDGVNDGAYGGCGVDCTSLAPRCGDAVVDEVEVCDDGVNDGAYGGCGVDCTSRAPYCGDALVDASEACDDGLNTGAAGACAAMCAGSVPLIGALSDISVPARLSVQVAVSASDADGSAPALSMSGPSFATFFDAGDGSGTWVVSPGPGDVGSYSFTLSASDGSFSDSATRTLTVSPAPPDDTLCINEFVAASQSVLADEDGALGDWIELHNFGLLPADLAGWCLTDDALAPQKWCVDSGSVAPGAFEVVFASDKDRQSTPRHTNFKLSKGGEYLGLFKPDGTLACGYDPAFPVQYDDISYGTGADGNATYFTLATPGAANATGVGALHRPRLYAPNQTVTAGTTLTTLWTASDEDGDLTTFSLLSAPPFMTLTDGGSGAASVVMSPGVADVGVHEVVVRASDGILFDDDTVQVEVLPATVPLASWNDLGIYLDAILVVADDVGGRLFLSVDEALQAPTDLVATLRFSGPNYTLAFDGGPPRTSEETVTLLSVQSNDSVVVDLYESGAFVASYDLVLTPLPVVRLSAASVVNEPKLPGTFRLADAWRAREDTGTQVMGIEYRGGTAQGQPKKPYAMELRDANDEALDVNLVGLRSDSDWQLDAAYRDQSLVRNIVSHDLYNDIHPFAYLNANGSAQGQGTIRGVATEAVLNGGYEGIYILQERVDRKLLDLKKVAVVTEVDGTERWDLTDLDEPQNGSVLYKAQSNNANFFHPESVASDFEQKYPPEDEVVHYGPLQALIAFVHNSDDATFVAEVADRVDLDNLIDVWIIRLVSSNTDTFKKNYYVARSEQGKFFWVPWDFDATYGTSWTGAARPSVTFWYPEQNQLIGRLNSLPATGFNTLLKARWTALRTQVLTSPALAARFAAYFDVMGDAVDGSAENARWRNRQRWPGAGGAGSADATLGTEAYIAAWLEDRLIWLDAQIAAQPE